MFKGNYQGFGIEWGSVVNTLLPTVVSGGISIYQAEQAKKIAKQQAAAAQAQAAALQTQAQAEMAKAQQQQAGFGSLKLSPVMLLLIIGVPAAIFLLRK